MNSSMKRTKSERSLTASLSLVPTRTVQLYKLDKLSDGAERATIYQFPRIYPISPFIGWSYMKEAFQVDRSKERCHVFRLSEGNSGVGGMSQASIPVTGDSPCIVPTNIPEIHVFTSDSKTPVEFLRFAFFLKPDEVDPQPEPNQVNSFINLELVTGSGYKCDIELKTSPAFSSLSNGSTVVCAEDYQGRERIFYGLVDKNHPQWSRVLSEFLICKSGDGRLSTIRIKGFKSIPVIPKGFEVTPQTVLTPFSLLDKENKRYSCHKEILEDQWSFLRQKLEENPGMNEMKIEGGSATVDVVLHHFYYPQKSLPPIKSVGEVLELLNVALQFEIPKLSALAVDILIEKMDMAESTQLVKLYGLIHRLKFKIQIFYKLWSALVIRMTVRIVTESDGYYASGSILCVESFTEDGYFRFEILQGLYLDLKQPRDALINEDETERIHAVQAIERFKDVVIVTLASKLRTSKIQL